MKTCSLFILVAAFTAGVLSDPIVDCNKYQTADGAASCADFADQYHLTEEIFLVINPQVTTCPSLASGDYCVAGIVRDGMKTTIVD